MVTKSDRVTIVNGGAGARRPVVAAGLIGVGRETGSDGSLRCPSQMPLHREQSGDPKQDPEPERREPYQERCRRRKLGRHPGIVDQ